MFDVFPWTLIEKIGTIDNTISTQVQQVLAGIEHQPIIAVEQRWYF
jgi:ssDNA thymidine ADP-ribosyltransferase, DarT